jgi:nicotinamidase/pyrazinamidase
MKEALLIIDMLNDFVRLGAPLEVPEARKIIHAIRQEIESARALGRPVIYLCDYHMPQDKEFSKFGWPAHAVRGTKGAEIVRELAPQEGDIIIRKTTYSGFFGTNLDETLRRLGVDTIRFTGDVTHICILFTAADAVLRDYRVLIVENGVAGLAKEDHDAALRIMKNVLGATSIIAGGTVARREQAA